MSDVFEPYELYRFENVVLDIARNFGNESTQSKDRIKRVVNRAGTLVAGHDRKWSWMSVTSSFNTVSAKETYSLDQEVRDLLSIWKTGENRGTIDRIPSRQFTRYVPDTSVYSGVPRMYDEQGVDTNGAKIISLFPIPSGVYEINYRYFRHILPLKNDQDNLRAKWGMPPNVIECVIQMATALLFKGIDDDRYKSERAEAEAMTIEAYAADQATGNTVIRVPTTDPDLMFSDGPILPPNFGN